ncbi:MAG: UDP-N-acetylmuramoyl-L-alanine--D-glutamate ligase [Legionella sp.]|nr:UDP-N-acetylmuramoyl-L-alanine--D-glutamate ligase [Legionella sp.]
MNSLYLVVGFGKTGLSVARYLHRNNKTFVGFDTRLESPGLNEFKTSFPNVPVHLQTFPEELLSQITDIILSPGLSLDLPFLKKAREAGLSIYGDIECLAQEISAPIVAITGTNGKSTVTSLVGEMARAAGFKVAIAGNIGTCVLDMLADGTHYDLWVLELSSFQLELTHSLRPAVATILNITPDHLDRHHSLEAYIEAKQRIYNHCDTVIFNRDDEWTLPLNTPPKAPISFGLSPASSSNWGLIKFENNDETYLAQGEDYFFPVSALLIKGVHNWLNALVASALAHTVGVPRQAMVQVLKTFPGLAHRCQWVRTLDGVDWMNDSKGTNVGATISAINGIGSALTGKIVLIAGGQGKGANFSELTQVVSDFVRALVLIGEDTNAIESALGSVVPTLRACSLEEAIAVARTKAQPADVVLLSPACASMDMFCDFNHRGEVFMAYVNGLQ